MLATVWHCPPANRGKEWGEGKGGEGERNREGKHRHGGMHQHRGKIEKNTKKNKQSKIEEGGESISVVYTPGKTRG